MQRWKAGVNVAVDFEQWIKDNLKALGDPEKLIEEVLKVVGQTSVTATKIRFEKETDPSGKAWKKLAPMTIKFREEKGYTPINILRQSGALVRSINSRIDLNNRSAIVSSNVEYGEKHQEGQGVPQRKWLDTDNESKQESELIDIAIEEKLEEFLKRL
jgi:phage virion morphogenesis protein